MKILIINGPNLNLLGKREPDIYGHQSFEDFLEELRSEFAEIEIAYFQSNIEGEIIDIIHLAGFEVNGILLNAGGYTHTSVAIGDSISAINSPVVEVHISNILARESFRHTSLIAAVCAGSISGFGLDGYRLAIESIVKKLQ